MGPVSSMKIVLIVLENMLFVLSTEGKSDCFEYFSCKVCVGDAMHFQGPLCAELGLLSHGISFNSECISSLFVISMEFHKPEYEGRVVITQREILGCVCSKNTRTLPTCVFLLH